MLLILVASDVVMIGGVALLEQRPRDTAHRVPQQTHNDKGGSSECADANFALCLTTDNAGEAAAPNTVAITYLDAQLDDGVTAADVKSWFGDLDPNAIEVRRLTYKDGHRRVAFELSAAHWADWNKLSANK